MLQGTGSRARIGVWYTLILAALLELLRTNRNQEFDPRTNGKQGFCQDFLSAAYEFLQSLTYYSVFSILYLAVDQGKTAIIKTNERSILRIQKSTEVLSGSKTNQFCQNIWSQSRDPVLLNLHFRVSEHPNMIAVQNHITITVLTLLYLSKMARCSWVLNLQGDTPWYVAYNGKNHFKHNFFTNYYKFYYYIWRIPGIHPNLFFSRIPTSTFGFAHMLVL